LRTDIEGAGILQASQRLDWWQTTIICRVEMWIFVRVTRLCWNVNKQWQLSQQMLEKSAKMAAKHKMFVYKYGAKIQEIATSKLQKDLRAR